LVGVVDALTVLNSGLPIPSAGDFLLMLPSNDVYVNVVPDCELDNLMNEYFVPEDDDPNNCNKALSSFGVCCQFGELAVVAAGGKRRSWRVE
jgi:hypothetical protein